MNSISLNAKTRKSIFILAMIIGFNLIVETNVHAFSGQDKKELITAGIVVGVIGTLGLISLVPNNKLENESLINQKELMDGTIDFDAITKAESNGQKIDIDTFQNDFTYAFDNSPEDTPGLAELDNFASNIANASPLTQNDINYSYKPQIKTFDLPETNFNDLDIQILPDTTGTLESVSGLEPGLEITNSPELSNFSSGIIEGPVEPVNPLPLIEEL